MLDIDDAYSLIIFLERDYLIVTLGMDVDNLKKLSVLFLLS